MTSHLLPQRVSIGLLALVAVMTYRQDGQPVIREMPAWPAQDR
jgi:hypothetical protein